MKSFRSNKQTAMGSEKRLYRLALATVISLIFFNQILIQYILNQQKYDAKTISMAGRQQLLCGQIVDLMTDNPDQVPHNMQLQKIVEEWNMVHHALQNGDATLGVDKLDGEEVLDLFRLANPYQYKIYDQATGKYLLDNIYELKNSAEQYNAAMGQVVKKCEVHAQRKISATIVVEIALAALTLLVLVFEIRYIFRPAFLRINRQQLLLKRENKNLKKTQELMRAIQNSTSLAIIVIDRDFRIISLNKKAVRNFRFVQSAPVREGMPVIHYIPPHIRTSFIENLHLVLSGKSTKDEYCVMNLQNKTRWYEIEFHPMKEDSGQINGVAFSVKDITRNKEYEIHLEQQNQRLTKIAFLQAHELRGPITSMLGLVDLITEEKATNINNGHLNEEYIQHFKNLSGKVDKIIHDIVSESAIDINEIKKSTNNIKHRPEEKA